MKRQELKELEEMKNKELEKPGAGNLENIDDKEDVVFNSSHSPVFSLVSSYF